MDALIGIYGVVHTFGTKIIIKKNNNKIGMHGKKLVHNWNLILNLKNNYGVVPT